MSFEFEPEFRAGVGDDRAALQGPDFGVEFRRLGDRWTHAIGGHEPGCALAQSASAPAGSEGPSRIVSPPYQGAQLHGPDAGSARCVLLTGLFFKHHCSAAVTLAGDPARRGRVLLDIDVADRCRSQVESLAATYLVGFDSGALAAADPERIA